MAIEFKCGTKYSLLVPTSMGIRLTPVDSQPFHCSDLFQMQVTSAETNVASVASFLGLKVKVLTAFVKGSPVARMIKDNLAGRHMDYEGKEFEQGGPWGLRHQFNLADSGYYVMTASQGSKISYGWPTRKDFTLHHTDSTWSNYKGNYETDGTVYWVNKGTFYTYTLVGGTSALTYSLVRGLGYDFIDDDYSGITKTSGLMADQNADGVVTFAELFSFTKADMKALFEKEEEEYPHVPQVYPTNSDKVFFAR